MKQSSIETKPVAAPRRRRRILKNQIQQGISSIPETPVKEAEMPKEIDYQVSIAYTQPRRHRPALLPEEQQLCDLRHKIIIAKNIAPFGNIEVVGYDKGAQEKPYLSGGGFFIQVNDNELIAWRMGVYETFCLGLHTETTLLALLENISENAKTRIQ